MARVLILGATSAIAAEVARAYAQRGDSVLLIGRNPEKLGAVQALIAHEIGSPVQAVAADFNDLAANEKLIAQAIAELGGLDVALVAHGELGDQEKSENDFAEAERILRTNFVSVIALLIPIANHMQAARQGRIGVITSVAGERGRPRNFTYGAAKGALNVYLQGLRSRLYGAGVTVTTLKLGPVETPMTVDHPKNALFARPGPVAASIIAALDQGATEAFVPWYWRPIMSIVRKTPESLFQKIPFLSGR